MKTEVRKPVAPFYAVAALWIVYALLFPLYAPAHYALLIAASAAVYLVANALCKSGGVVGEKKAAPKAEKKQEQTGSAELDKMLRDGRLAIAEMKRLDDNIADPGVSDEIVRLEQVSEKIFEAVKEQPEKLSQIHKFIDYYLHTTLKLLNAYDRMSAAGVSGENIDTTLNKVEGMMRNIVAAFEKQLDALYGSDALDISTDITVLETMMAREGLMGQPLKTETAPEDGTDIKLEL